MWTLSPQERGPAPKRVEFPLRVSRMPSGSDSRHSKLATVLTGWDISLAAMKLGLTFREHRGQPGFDGSCPLRQPLHCKHLRNSKVVVTPPCRPLGPAQRGMKTLSVCSMLAVAAGQTEIGSDLGFELVGESGPGADCGTTKCVLCRAVESTRRNFCFSFRRLSLSGRGGRLCK